MTEVQVFRDDEHRDAHDDYVRWVTHHPGGFVLNLTGASKAMLHDADCLHIGIYETDPSFSLTDNTKVCSTKARELRGWAQGHSIRVKNCRTCRY